jgi:oligopeptide transport system ATP-binding protein
MSGQPLLDIRGLAVSFQRDRDAPVSRALRGVDLSVTSSEIHGLVGESGCGKTVTSTAVMGLLPAPPARIEAGSIVFDGRDLLGLSSEERRKVRGRQVAMVFQEPARYLNPSLRVGGQITEMLRLHLGMSRPEATARAEELAGLVGLGGARRVLRAYPHELSGGMKQRAMIAIAISCNPRLLIADEPTTALDVTLQMQILRLIVRLRETFRMGILFISHDLRLVRTVADRVTVMYAGRAVETGPSNELYRGALHPYTRLLLASIPAAQKRGTRLRVIPGRVPDAQAIPPGCAFHPRCPIAEDRCRTEMPANREHAPGRAAACHCVGKPWPD